MSRQRGTRAQREMLDAAVEDLAREVFRASYENLDREDYGPKLRALMWTFPAVYNAARIAARAAFDIIGRPVPPSQAKLDRVSAEPLRLARAAHDARAQANHARAQKASGMPHKPHTTDADCTVDPDTWSCVVCGVDHSGTCHVCGGHGFHTPHCPESDENRKDEQS